MWGETPLGGPFSGYPNSLVCSLLEYGRTVQAAQGLECRSLLASGKCLLGVELSFSH